MTANQLLRLYPRSWRERYATELLAMLGDERLQLQQIIDIVAGAVDAWLSAEVRRASVASTTSGGTMATISVCARNQARYTTRDSAIGAAVNIIGTALLVIAGVALRRAGLTEIGSALINMSYLIALTVSMPFWLLKGQPRKAQTALIGVTMVLLLIVNAIILLL